jgi:hypothetical protein
MLPGVMEHTAAQLPEVFQFANDVLHPAEVGQVNIRGVVRHGNSTDEAIALI